MKCLHCEQDTPADTGYCGNCGVRLPIGRSPTGEASWGVAIFFVFLVLIGFCVLFGWIVPIFPFLQWF